MYTIKPFLIHRLDEGCVLQTGTNTVMIKNEELFAFLENIEINKIKEIQKEEIKDVFDVSHQVVIEFLLNNEIIIQEKEKNMQYNKVHLFSNNQLFSETFKSAAVGIFDSIEIKDINSDLKNVKENDLCLLFLNPFNLKKYIELVDKLTIENVIIKTVFFYNHSLYISNYHKQEWNNPCPKCFYYSLETQLRGTINSNNINFQIIIDMIYEQSETFEVQANLNTSDFLEILNILLSDFKYNKNPNQYINKVYEIDLKDGRVNQDFSYHWELCDCYE